MPDDDWLEEYEESVRMVAHRRLIYFLFSATKPTSLGFLMRHLKMPLTAIAHSFSALRAKGYATESEDGIALTVAGRKWAIRERKGIFWPRVVVRYQRLEQRDSYTRDNGLAPRLSVLPDSFRLPKDLDS
ncbi:hypothetical protein [Paucibacter sp. DJ2R-2]|uniref:hypothetical protein n=1 Tax=Paucibacter sp. DJ2R-2 TaxID=2893558 RepID=UPI0021E39957|nr:hypothetical protein [Paucibacter sp. DJ2R-2]MCV2421338.1 hypothetical protein [Paucibacter sp. DJ4R-1]MCV2441207.1 hypothetical protein [Paucibacter sp. DJ2R-2]